MTKEEIQVILNQTWQSKDIKVDWLKLEQLQRDIFKAYAQNKITQHETLCYLAESLEAFTKRDLGAYLLFNLNKE